MKKKKNQLIEKKARNKLMKLKKNSMKHGKNNQSNPLNRSRRNGN